MNWVLPLRAIGGLGTTTILTILITRNGNIHNSDGHMLTQLSNDACRYADAIGGDEFHLPLSTNDDVLFSASLNEVAKNMLRCRES